MPTDVGTNENQAFQSPKIVPILVGVFLFLFFGGILLLTFLDDSGADFRTNSQSYSAVGHHALQQILQKNNFRVWRGHQFFYSYQSGQKIAFLEPNLKFWQSYTQQTLATSIRKILRRGNDVIVACPKWQVYGKTGHTWASDCDLLKVSEVNSFLQNLDLDIKIERKITGNAQVQTCYDHKNYLLETETLQVFSCSRKTYPLVRTKNGEEIACIVPMSDSGVLILISDPDLFNNMFIGRADNGLVMLSLLRKTTKGKIWIDEIAHGRGSPPSIIRALLSYPAICVTFQVLLLGGFLAWLAGVRFQPPIPLSHRSRSVEEQVKAFANITCAGKKHNYFLKKYIKSIVHELEAHYPSIASLPFSCKIEYLEQLGKASGNPYSIKTLYLKGLKVRLPRNITIIAKGIHKWKERMILRRKSIT